MKTSCTRWAYICMYINTYIPIQKPAVIPYRHWHCHNGNFKIKKKNLFIIYFSNLAFFCVIRYLCNNFLYVHVSDIIVVLLFGANASSTVITYIWCVHGVTNMVLCYFLKIYLMYYSKTRLNVSRTISDFWGT